MTNEEKALQIKDEEKASEIVIKIQNSSSLDYDGRRAKYMYESAMQMAKWKDEDFAKEKQALIDKACGWLRKKCKQTHSWTSLHVLRRKHD
jgi:hypothetical protein